MPVTTAPMPMSTGLRSITRVMRIVSSVVGASKPGATIGTKTGAKIAITRLKSGERDEHEVDDAARELPRLGILAAGAVGREDRDERGADSAPATTSWKMASGMRNAAK